MVAYQTSENLKMGLIILPSTVKSIIIFNPPVLNLYLNFAQSSQGSAYFLAIWISIGFTQMDP